MHCAHCAVAPQKMFCPQIATHTQEGLRLCAPARVNCVAWIVPKRLVCVRHSRLGVVEKQNNTWTVARFATSNKFGTLFWTNQLQQVVARQPFPGAPGRFNHETIPGYRHRGCKQHIFVWTLKQLFDKSSQEEEEDMLRTPMDHLGSRTGLLVVIIRSEDPWADFCFLPLCLFVFCLFVFLSLSRGRGANYCLRRAESECAAGLLVVIIRSEDPRADFCFLPLCLFVFCLFVFLSFVSGSWC